MELIDKANANPPDSGARRIVKRSAILARDKNFTCGRRFQKASNMEQRGFASPRLAHQRHDLTGIDLKRQILEYVQSPRPFRIGTVHMAKLKGRHHYSYLRASTGSSLAARHDG
jgi:hypothetical protein